MACLITYKGFLCLATSKIDPATLSDFHISTHNHPSGQLFDLLSEQTRIDFSVIEDTNRIEFVPLNSYQNRFGILHARTFLPELQEGFPVSSEVLETTIEYGSLNTVGRSTEENRVMGEVVNGKVR